MSAIADHLWQSTWFALGAALLALLARHESAQVRYWIWLTASLKFVFPFSLLTLLGNQLIVQVENGEALLPLVQQVARPLTNAVPTSSHLGQGLAQFLLAVWVTGSLILFVRLLRDWWHSRSLLQHSLPSALNGCIPIRSSNRLSVPGVVGVIDPMLLMPTHLLRDLTPEQLNAVISHEMWHVRRRDNLAAVVHSLIETVFWFHPLVWWIGSKLRDERELACDEGVLRDGNDPVTYAEALLKVCQRSIAFRIAWVAEAGGGELKSRIRCLLSNQPPPQFTAFRRSMLAAALLSCAMLPVASGMTLVVTSGLTVAAGAHSIRVSEAGGPAIIIVGNDSIYGRNVSLRELIGRVYSLPAREVTGSVRGLDHPRYDIEMRSVADGSTDVRQLVAELLDQQFNVELIVRPMGSVQSGE